MKLLKDKNVVITGASRGIGKSILELFVKNGANVAFSYIGDPSQVKSIEKDFSNHNQKVVSYISDASDFEQSQKLIDDVVNDFGSVDVLINNAGITIDNLLMRMSEQDFNKVIDVNLKSVFNTTKAILKTMLRQRSGSIINMSSVVGVKGNAGQSNYSASKAGMIGFTKSMALELGSRNIRCNCIAPGFIETEMTEQLSDNVVQSWRDSIPLKRGGSTNDVANVALFLASDLSSYVTGQVINVCGGMLT
tara:strand:- start:5572 stop:6318 length:747 start_codon:yes stop_codon:yes gene_type:complete